MADGVISVHGTIAQSLVEALNIVGIEYVIVPHQHMEETIVRLTDPQILRLKCVMRIHAPVSSKFLMYYYQMFVYCFNLKQIRLNSVIYLIAVDGGFSDWDDWTPCTAECGGGDQTRSRRCDSPAPQFGGLDCGGDFTECQRCNLDPCPSTCPA